MAQAHADHPPPLPPRADWAPLVDMAIAEDLGDGDVTTNLLLEPERIGQARVEARTAMTVCGLPILDEIFRRIDPQVHVEVESGVADGIDLEEPQPLLRVRGRYASILAAERTALNFLGRLSGIATQTRQLVNLVRDLPAKLVDTRKTTPGWRSLEKYAVAMGGGINHRIGLYDAVLIKDNHIAAAGGFDLAVRRALADAPPGMPVQVEVESESMADRAVELGCDFLLLDNMLPETIQRIVERHAPGILLEASGGIGPHNLRRYAETGVARISMGMLTHSVDCADVALEIDLVPNGVSSHS